MNAFRRALVAIVASDGPVATAGTVQALCGRATGCIRAFRPLAGVALPIVTYTIIDAPRTTASGDHRRVIVQLDTWADEATGGTERADQLAARVQAILTEPAFRAQGVDAAPVAVRERDGTDLEDEPQASGRRRRIVELTFSYQRG